MKIIKEYQYLKLMVPGLCQKKYKVRISSDSEKDEETSVPLKNNLLCTLKMEEPTTYKKHKDIYENSKQDPSSIQ